MKYLKPALLFAAALLAGSTAAQQAAPPAAPKTEATPADEQAAPKQPPIRRRSVQQTIEHMPASPPVATEGYRPPPAVPPPAAPGAAPGPVPPPVQINSCDAGGCTDTNGTRYNRGTGNTLLSPQGRLCTGIGPTLQCF